MDIQQEQLNEILSSIINDPEKLMRFCISIGIDVLRLTIENVQRVHVLTQKLATPPRIPMNVSSFTGVDWINEILEGHPLRCFNSFRMNKETFVKLAYLLENRYHLRERGKLKPIERTALFLHVLSRDASNRETQERFTHGAATVSDHFDDVLRAVLNLGNEYIKQREGHFTTVADKIYSSDMYNPFFKDCVGALDGCHVELTVPERERPKWLNRKGETSTNVLAVCDFDLIFIFVLPGWEGSAHDARILIDAMQDHSLGFPLPPDGKYYLGDKGYPNRKGILTPYGKVNYHRSDFTLDNPRGPKERFNRAHSSLRSAIE